MTIGALRLITISGICLATIVTGIVVWQRARAAVEAQTRQASKVFQSNVVQLSNELQPGEVGKFFLPAQPADTLIYLPAYCEKEKIAAAFPDLPSGVLGHLAWVSGDDRRSPALVWLSNNKIIAAQSGRFGVGMNGKLRRWDVRTGTKVYMKKELTSPNSFLSLEFVDPVPDVQPSQAVED